MSLGGAMLADSSISLLAILVVILVVLLIVYFVRRV